MARDNEKSPDDNVPSRGMTAGGKAQTKKQAAEMSEMTVLDPTDKGAGLPPKLQAHLGRQLRAMYDEVAQEPVPDRLLQLLRQLDSGEPE